MTNDYKFTELKRCVACEKILATDASKCECGAVLEKVSFYSPDLETPIDESKRLTVEHVDWFLKIVKPLMETEFIHGYKHGFERKRMERTDFG
jgi:hypothetical protein